MYGVAPCGFPPTTQLLHPPHRLLTQHCHCRNRCCCCYCQVSGLINRPEIPRLAGAKQPLLVKAYDLGLIDALGRTEGRAVRELLAAAQSQVCLGVGEVDRCGMLCKIEHWCHCAVICVWCEGRCSHFYPDVCYAAADHFPHCSVSTPR